MIDDPSNHLYVPKKDDQEKTLAKKDDKQKK